MPLALLGGAAAHAAASDRVELSQRAQVVASRPPTAPLLNVELVDHTSTARPAASPVTPSSTHATAPTTTDPAPTVTTTTQAAASAPQVAIEAPTTTTSPPATSSARGLATWYDWFPGQCASPTLPKGTEVTVTNAATGASTTCEVTDREADNPGHVIDLDQAVFAQIASPSSGAIEVTISW